MARGTHSIGGQAPSPSEVGWHHVVVVVVYSEHASANMCNHTHFRDSTQGLVLHAPALSYMLHAPHVLS
jgi:hypothetical protein